MNTFVASLIDAAVATFPADVIIVTIDPMRAEVLFTVQRGDRAANYSIAHASIGDNHVGLIAQVMAAARQQLEAYKVVNKSPLHKTSYVPAVGSGMSDLFEVDSE